jgi:Flp pilus assembly protein TadD
LYLGQALSDLGRLDQAEAVFRDVLRRNPGSADAHVGLGDVIARRGDLAGASQQLKRALVIEPGNPRAASALRRIKEAGHNNH